MHSPLDVSARVTVTKRRAVSALWPAAPQPFCPPFLKDPHLPSLRLPRLRLCQLRVAFSFAVAPMEVEGTFGRGNPTLVGEPRYRVGVDRGLEGQLPRLEGRVGTKRGTNAPSILQPPAATEMQCFLRVQLAMGSPGGQDLRKSLGSCDCQKIRYSLLGSQPRSCGRTPGA